MSEGIASLSVFLRFAALAGFFRLWWESSGILFGTDAPARSGAVLGVCLALLFVSWMFRDLTSRKQRRASGVLLAMGWALCFLPFWGAGKLWVFSSDPAPLPWMIALHAIFFAPSAFFASRSLAAASARFPAVLLGLAAGVLLHESLLLPAVGWLWSELFWAALLVFAISLGKQDPPLPVEAPSGWMDWLGAGLCAFLAGASLAIGRDFLPAHLSSTRWSYGLIFAISLLGLGLGGLAASFFRPNSWGLWTRLATAGVCGIASVFAAQTIFSAMATMSAPRGEFFVCVQALGLSTVLAGASLQIALARRKTFSLLVLACGLGLILGSGGHSARAAGAIFAAPLDKLIPRKLGEQVFERKVTEEGIYRRIRNPAVGHSAVVYWNRDPWSRQPEWIQLEQEEIFLPARLHPKAARALVVGTPFGSHRTAMSVAAIPSIEVADAMPPFLNESGGSGGANSLAEDRYDWIVLLSSPAAIEGRGLWLTEDFFRRASKALRSEGSLVVWVELRNLPHTEVATLLRTFTEVFPNARLWLGQDLYAGPLLGLDSGAVKIKSLPVAGLVNLLAEGPQIREIAGEGPVSSLLRPRLEWSAPMAPPPFGLPSAEQLRSLASLLAPTPEKRTGAFYFLDSLAIHAEEQIPGNLFSSHTDRVGVSQDEIEQATTGMELHPDYLPLHRHLAALGKFLLEKRDYENALRFFPRWNQAQPENLDFLLMLARTHHELLDDQLALPFADKAAALAPTHAEAHELLGDVHAALKHWKDAILSLQTAVSLAPEIPKLAKKLGLAYMGAGELSPARDWLMRAQVGMPGDRELATAIEKLKK